MSWTLASYTCVAIASSAVTIAIVAETQPYINDEGEEEYTLSGYMILATAYVVKLPFKLVAQLFKSRNDNVVVESKPTTVEIIEPENEYELIV